MDRLNYHHLEYFWTVAREGSIAAASRRLHVGRASISAQIKTLETSIGTSLFTRRGRHLELTDTGKLTLEYADEIFSKGEELADVLRGQAPREIQALRVGVADVMLKLVAFRILRRAIDSHAGIRLTCVEGPATVLFGRLAMHELDVVLADTAPPASASVRTMSRALETSAVSLFASQDLAESLRDLPGSLAGAPLLLPGRDSSLRRSVELWLRDRDLTPRIVGEFDDSALLKIFGEAGFGAFPAPRSVADDLYERYGFVRVGDLEGLSLAAVAVFPDRKHIHPAVQSLFAV